MEPRSCHLILGPRLVRFSGHVSVLGPYAALAIVGKSGLKAKT
jgi:hypothetical protein